MTRLALVALLVSIPGLTAHAQEPKPAITELEGIWREPLKPSEKAEDKFSVAFAGDKVTISQFGLILKGTFAIVHWEGPVEITVTVDSVDGLVLASNRYYRGTYGLARGELNLQFEPPFPRVEIVPNDIVKLDPADLNDPDRLSKRLAEIKKHFAAMDARRSPSLHDPGMRRAPVSYKLEKVKK